MECVLVMVGTNIYLGGLYIVPSCGFFVRCSCCHHVQYRGLAIFPFMILLNCNLIVSYIALRPLSENLRGCLRRLIRLAKKRYFWCLVCGPTTNPTCRAVWYCFTLFVALVIGLLYCFGILILLVMQCELLVCLWLPTIRSHPRSTGSH